ncbi:tRNA(Ile)-lysidine synthase [Natronospira proteinivora]|uniref:tRNA(Ile)-lysidine synthase n=1 Tax=Natronospira proteinivora TaxID=1807133 RepID=A0ABT1G5R1_9GAMM|nr:tRNA lysidine(34) synthetase TilS [Natronospira proteinivora]MCP1726635.1 tRNA(Ile)-lysidine synthase [Natronospira proteinivora]
MWCESDQIIARVLAFLQEKSPFRRAFLALSGGRDSTVLLHLLATYGDEFPLTALHVDHALHPRSADWVEHCRVLCDHLGVAFESRRVQVNHGAGESLEAAARSARYAVLADFLGPDDVLMTAHHADDQLETLLYRLVRGTGGRGLAGIRAERSLGPGRLLRPMLAVEGEALAHYAERHHLSWLEDPSNEQARFDRNYLRHQILPRLKKRWPAAAALAAGTARHLAEEAELLESLAGEDRRTAASGGGLSVAALHGMRAARRHNLLRYWIRDQAGEFPSSAGLARLDREVLQARVDAQPELLLAGLRLRRHGGRIYCVPEAPASRSVPAQKDDREWKDLSAPLALPGNGELLLESTASGGLDVSKFRGPPTVCYRQGGEQYHDGRHHRRLKEWMRLAEIPPEQRDWLPILRDGERIVAAGENLLDPSYAAENGLFGYRIVWRKAPA